MLETGLFNGVHLTSEAFEELIANRLLPEDLEVSVRHLQECAGCRGGLRHLLEQQGVEKLHPVARLLAGADEWARFAETGEEATRVERAHLRAHGVNPVYQQHGVLVEELPDRRVRPIASDNEIESRPHLEPCP